MEQKYPTLLNKQCYDDKERLTHIVEELQEKPEQKQVNAILDALYSTKPLTVLSQVSKNPLGDLK